MRGLLYAVPLDSLSHSNFHSLHTVHDVSHPKGDPSFWYSLTSQDGMLACLTLWFCAPGVILIGDI